MTSGDNPGGADGGDEASAPPSARELLVLQLLVRGYSPSQIDRLLDLHGQGEAELRRAAERLSAATPHDAANAARRRGLIV